MRKKIVFESYEKDSILSLHNKEKFLSEQETKKGMTPPEAREFFNSAKEAGCLTDDQLNFKELYRIKRDDGQQVLYISADYPSGSVKRVFNDFTFDVIKPDGTKQEGFWDCPEITDTKLKKYIDQGYQKPEDILFKLKKEDPKFYKTIKVDDKVLYFPLYDYKEQAGKKENYPVDSQQYKILKGLEDKNFVINPSQDTKLFDNLEKVNYSIDTKLFPKGLEIYQSQQKGSQANISGAKSSRTSSTVSATTCEESVIEYWNMYKDKMEPSGPDFQNIKDVVQKCTNQRMYRWKDIGGVLGIGGGARRLDRILEVLTNKALEYENVRQPGIGRPYALKPPPTEKR